MLIFAMFLLSLVIQFLNALSYETSVKLLDIFSRISLPGACPQILHPEALDSVSCFYRYDSYLDSNARHSRMSVCRSTNISLW